MHFSREARQAEEGFEMDEDALLGPLKLSNSLGRFVVNLRCGALTLRHTCTRCPSPTANLGGSFQS